MNEVMQRIEESIALKQQSFTSLGYHFSGSDQSIGALRDDSRDVQMGDTFICLPRAAEQAEKFIAAAIAAGAGGVIVVGEAMIEMAVPTLLLADMNALGLFLRRYFHTEASQVHCIGITGTDGKTSVTWMLREALTRHFGKQVWSSGTLGWMEDAQHIHDLGNTTPSLLTLHRLLAAADQHGVAALVLEVSSHGIEQQRIAGLHFDAAIWTTLGHDHLQDHGGFEAYAELKASFVRKVAEAGGTVVANFNQAGVVARLSPLPLWGYAVQPVEQSVTSDEGELMQWRVLSRGVLQLFCYGERVDVQGVPVGLFHAENLAAVAQLLRRHFHLNVTQIVDALHNMAAPPGRMQAVDSALQIFVDYAHTPEGLQACLESARMLCQGRLMVVFGCGGERDHAKRPEMGAIAADYADWVCVTSDNPRHEAPELIIHDILQGMPYGAYIRQHVKREDAIADAIAEMNGDDVLVIAGKGHENYMDVQGVRRAWSDVACAQACVVEKKQGSNPCG